MQQGYVPNLLEAESVVELGHNMPDVNALGHELALEVSIPALVDVAGLEHELPGAVEYPHLVLADPRMDRVEDAVGGVVLGVGPPPWARQRGREGVRELEPAPLAQAQNIDQVGRVGAAEVVADH